MKLKITIQLKNTSVYIIIYITFVVNKSIGIPFNEFNFFSDDKCFENFPRVLNIVINNSSRIIYGIFSF